MLPAVAQEAVDQFLMLIHAALPGRIDGFYIVGSTSFGAFRPVGAVFSRCVQRSRGKDRRRDAPLESYRLRLWFDDGSDRVVDLADSLWGTMGEPLRDPGYFRLVRVDPELRTVAWPNGFDRDPDVLHGDHEPAPPGHAGQPAHAS